MSFLSPPPASSRGGDEVTVSAPGKILLAGGYLVLEEPNVGLVVAVDKRFYCRCRKVDCLPNQNANLDTSNNVISIRVHSPQFESTWMYQYDVSKHSFSSRNDDSSSSSSNPFIEKALKVALLYLFSKKETTMKPIQLDITIAADNDFYSLVPHLQSRKLPNTLQAAESLPLFLPACKNHHTHAVYKTGLGSSACLVTSLVGALIHSLQQSVTKNDHAASTTSPMDEISKLSQIAHCYAQGKIGSGFDVSAACYGSHIYQRFPSQMLQELLQQLDDDDNTADETLLLQQIMQCSWSGGVQSELRSFHASSFLQVIMADVSGGSESPSMAKQVLQWKKTQQQQSSSNIPHWDDLIQINQTIVELLQKLETMTQQGDDKDDLQQQKQWLIQNANRWSELQTENSLVRLLVQLQDAFHNARYHLKHMGIAAGNVPIEPDIQTELCNTCESVPGVIAAFVPGAGGYDAVVVVYIHDESVRNHIANVWTQWKPSTSSNQKDDNNEAVVCALTVRGANYGEGVRLEPNFPMPI